jgi:hypothetical protein
VRYPCWGCPPTSCASGRRCGPGMERTLFTAWFPCRADSRRCTFPVFQVHPGYLCVLPLPYILCPFFRPRSHRVNITARGSRPNQIQHSIARRSLLRPAHHRRTSRQCLEHANHSDFRTKSVTEFLELLGTKPDLPQDSTQRSSVNRSSRLSIKWLPCWRLIENPVFCNAAMQARPENRR